MRRAFLVCGIAFLLYFSTSAFAQSTATGYPPYGSFAPGQFDTVNLFDLNYNFGIPLVSTPGRGMNFNLSAVYNSINWINLGGAWSVIGSYGWMLDAPTGQVGYSYRTSRSKCGFVDGLPEYTYITSYTNYTYTDPLGTVHAFNVNWYYTEDDCTGNDQYSGTYTGYATDGSGYYADVSNPAPPTIISPAGIQVGNTGMTDTNGNYISSTQQSGETDWTDSAGHVAAKVITSGSSTEYEYYDSSGTLRTTTVNFTNFNIKTAFDCPGITEFSGPATLPTSIDLPNGQSYTFTYEPTPNNPSYITGRLQEITLPTGGTIEWTYSGSNDGMNCADGSIGNLTRTVNDGVNPPAAWLYNHISGQSNEYDPAPAYGPGTNITLDFNSSGQETSRVISQGSTTLRTINTTWASNSTPATRTVILDDGKTQSEIETTFDSYGNLDLLKEHDWGSGSPGPVIRTTEISYLNAAPYNTTLNMLNRPTVISVQDANGFESYTTIGYDQSGYINQSCPTNPPQHYSSYGCSYTTRGDPTSVTRYADPSNLTQPITHYKAYDSLGNVLSETADCCQLKEWAYSSATNYSYPDSETDGPSGGTQLTTKYTYSSYDGQLLSTEGPNLHTTSFAYDEMKRLTTVTRPDNSQIVYTYTDSAPPNLSISSPVGGTNAALQVTNYDGLGRPIENEIEDSSHNSYSFVQAQYDPVGRIYKISNPYTASPQYWTERDYDALDRVTKVILPDNSQTTYVYSANSVLETDPAGHQRKILTDALGRTSAVYEPDPSNNNSLTNLTSYTYTVNDDLSSVSEGSQTRSYSYDGLRNLISEITPEAGTVQYTYNAFGLVTARTDARGVVTNYSYDSLNRLTGISYTLPQGSQVAPMPNVCNPVSGDAVDNVCFYYDQGGTGANALGRLTQMTFALGNGSNPPTGSDTYSYDLLGQTTQVQNTIAGQTYTIGYQYNTAGEVTSIAYPSGRMVQRAYDAIGRLCEIAPQTSGCGNSTSPYATSYGYNPAFETTGFNYGNGVTASFGYSADRLQLTSLAYAKGTNSLFSLGYGYAAAGSNNGQVASITDNMDSGRSVSYVYDALGRITAATTTGSVNYPQWGMAWTYDRYGNRLTQSATAGTVPTSSVSVDPTTNRINSAGYGYDASGNMTNDGLNTLTYDAENRVVSTSGSLGSGTYVYDGNGLRVEKTVSGATGVYVFSGTKVIAEYAAGAAPTSPTTEYIYSGADLIGEISGSTLTYVHPDHLSVRLLTSSSGGVIGQQGHYPFGESWYSQNTTTKWQFTSYERDSESGNDYALERTYINRLGCFSSPDPLTASAIDNPQLWGRYSYVVNDPVDLMDQFGLQPPSTTSLTCQQLASGQKPHETWVNWGSGVLNAGKLFTEWASGLGPANATFGPGSVESLQMLSAPGMAQNVEAFLSGAQTSGRTTFGLKGLISAGGNPTAQFVGSYDWSMSLSGGSLNITVTNSTTAWSFFYHPRFLNPNPPTRTGWQPMGRINQTFLIRVPCHPGNPPGAPGGDGGGGGDSGWGFNDGSEFQWLFLGMGIDDGGGETVSTGGSTWKILTWSFISQ